MFEHLVHFPDDTTISALDDGEECIDSFFDIIRFVRIDGQKYVFLKLSVTIISF